MSWYYWLVTQPNLCHSIRPMPANAIYMHLS
jgi:hypothetical protein